LLQLAIIFFYSEHRKERGRAAFRGTTRYVSLTVHDRKETV